MSNVTVQLYGGGIDSVCIAHLHQPDIRVYFDLGTEEAAQEKQRALAAGAIVDSRLFLGDQVLPNKILPARNLLLVAMASYYGNTILLGSTAGDTTRDKDFTFITSASRLLSHILQHDPTKALPFHAQGVTVFAPGLHLTKTQLVRQYLEANGDPDALVNSRSCYTGHEVECGQCRSCVRKYVALRLNGLHPHMRVKPDLRQALAYAQERQRGEECNDIQRLIQQEAQEHKQ